MKDNIKSVRQVALKDLTKELEGIDINPREIWIVHSSHLDTKETQQLNRLLDLHKINKQK